MNARTVSLHESDHLLGAAVAAVGLGFTGDEYKTTEVHVTATATDGEFGAAPPDTIPDATRERLAQLYAIGPVAAAENAVDLMRAGDTKGLAEAGDLSTADLQLFAQFDGPPTLAVKTVLAVQHLRARLGFAGLEKMAKLIRDISNQHVEPLTLGDLVPMPAARGAWKAATNRLEKLMGGKSATEQINDRLRESNK